MEYLIGLTMALAVLGGASLLGLDRDRALYPVAMIVIAFYYVLFAVMGASTSILLMECVAAAIFIVAAAVGFRTGLWLVVVALASHGVFDYFHHSIIANPGVPPWWPGFCLSFDVVAAAYLAMLIRQRPALR